MAKQVAALGPLYHDLADYFAKTGQTQAEFASILGMTQAHVSRIRAGDLVPRPALAIRIASYARIPIESFQRAYLARHKRKSA